MTWKAPFIPLIALLIAGAAGQLQAQEKAPASDKEMWQTIRKQNEQIDRLQKEMKELQGNVKTTDDRLESVVNLVDSGVGSGAPSRTNIGAYGELHYNNLDDKHGDNKDSVDYHRFVAFLSHEFTDDIRFFSEIELEHALSGDGKPGEVELEQAYVEMDLDAADRHRVKTGVFLIPVGILNETHEPPTFYGTERNLVEKNIIPSTWWEAGLALDGQLADSVSYDLAYNSGLAVDSSYKIRGGRQKIAKAEATAGAWTGRLRWRRPGVELGVTAHYQRDLTQNGVNGAPEKSDGLLTEAHTALAHGPFSLRALYARWELDAKAAEDLGRDIQEGWYIEPGYRFHKQFGAFLRYSQWDNEAGNSVDTDIEEWTFGVNYWPHENVVFKIDYQDQNAPQTASEFEGFNIGFGYQF